MKLIDIAKELEHNLFSETKIAELEFCVVMKEREKDSFHHFLNKGCKSKQKEVIFKLS